MASPTEITASQLSRLIGTHDAPAIVDVCIDVDYALDPRLIPGSQRRSHKDVSQWAPLYAGRRVVVSCQKGLKLSQGVVALLRHAGIAAEALEGGMIGWREAGLPLVRTEHMPAPNAEGRSVWVTRERPKIDRIACPWLIRRFIDPEAVILFVKASEVEGVADRFGAAAFDIDGVFWSHRGEACTFDVMLEEFGIATEPLLRLAAIVRGADTARPELAPEAPGLLAVSLGLSRMFKDDLAQLEAGMLVYDALYRWCRDATGETHNWPTTTKTPS